MRRIGCLLLFTAFAVFTRAQSPKGAIEVVVQDNSGAALPGARLLLIQLWTLEEKRADVPHSGRYIFEHLDPGEYMIIAASPRDVPCFKPETERVPMASPASNQVVLKLKLDLVKCGEVVE